MSEVKSLCEICGKNLWRTKEYWDSASVTLVNPPRRVTEPIETEGYDVCKACFKCMMDVLADIVPCENMEILDCPQGDSSQIKESDVCWGCGGLRVSGSGTGPMVFIRNYGIQEYRFYEARAKLCSGCLDKLKQSIDKVKGDRANRYIPIYDGCEVMD